METRTMPHPLLFLSHSGADSVPVKELARHLRLAGVNVWLDIDDLKPGDRWMEELEVALVRADAFAVYVGRYGVNRWVDREVRIALARNTADPSFRLIPIMGPGADPSSIPDFLTQHQWLDLRKGIQPENLKRLVGAILEKPGEAVSILPPDIPPFRGLLPFDVEHALLFFGRDRETAELIDRLRAGPFVAVVGDSGSGKSSLIRAGLVPALYRGRFHQGGSWAEKWRIAICRPNDDPFREITNALLDLAPDLSTADRIQVRAECMRQIKSGVEGLYSSIAALVPVGAHTLIVIDQFEELFSRANELECGQFIDSLLNTVTSSGDHPVHVVITLRADFYSRCWEHPRLPKFISANQYALRHAVSTRLREIIEKPVMLAGAHFEEGLVDTILNEIGGEPGNLPLLEHALLQLWRRRNDGIITHAAYKEIGRVAGAIANHAEELYQSLNKPAKKIARKTFMRLVQPGEDTADTRRRAKQAEIYALGDDSSLAEKTMKTLVDSRLLTTHREAERGQIFIEVAHEALIQKWPRLRNWVNECRADLQFEHRLRETAREWCKHDCDPEELYGGVRLIQAEAWTREHKNDITAEVKDFVSASIAKRYSEGRRKRVYATIVMFLLATILVSFIATLLIWHRALLQQNRDISHELISVRKELDKETHDVGCVAFIHMLLFQNEKSMMPFFKEERHVLACNFLMDNRPLADKYQEYEKKFGNRRLYLFKVLVAEHHLRTANWDEAMRGYQEANKEKNDPYWDQYLPELVKYRIRVLNEQYTLGRHFPVTSRKKE